MKGVLLSILSLVCIFLLSFQIVGWVPYQSKEGHFSMKFPGQPTENTNNQKTSNGTGYTVHLAYYAVSPTETYALSWVDMHKLYPEKKTLKQILEDSRDGACKGIHATVNKTLAIELEKTPYIDFTYRSDNMAGRARIYMINKVQYNLLTTFPSEKDISSNAEKFVSSFHYTK